ncbi:hypothetical protein D3C75_692540 [compost metagenome]
MIKRGEHNAFFHAVLPDHPHNRLFHAVIGDNAVFQLNVQLQLRWGKQLQNLGQKRDAFTAVSLLAEGSVQTAELLPGPAVHRTCAVGCPVQCFVMNDHHLPVCRQLHIQLNAIGAFLHSQLESGHGIFRRVAGCSAMGINQRFHWICLLH